MAHAVEYRKDRRFWANGRGEIIYRILQRVGFHTQEHEVVRCFDFRTGDYFRSNDCITMRADDAKAIPTKLFRPGWTNEEGHVASGLVKPPAKVAADRTCANDQDPHGRRGKVLN